MPEEESLIDQLFSPLQLKPEAPLKQSMVPIADVQTDKKPVRNGRQKKKQEPEALIESEPETPEDLEPGHYINELDSQVSFFELKRGGVADAGTLNALLGEPYHVLPGQQYLLCKRHYLVIEPIIDPPHRWKNLLDESRVFIPWPDILAADIYNPTSYSVLMVQPDRYIAGLILNYYIERWGMDAVELIS